MDALIRNAMNYNVGLSVWLILLVTGLAANSAEVPGTPARRIISEYQDRVYEMLITREQLTLTPEWKFEDQNPPLSVREAMSIAARHLAKEVVEASGWRFIKVSLEPTSVQGRWIYVISFDSTPASEGNKLWPPFDVAVLMNGQPVDIRERRQKAR